MIILGTNSVKDTGYDVANSCRFNSGSDDHLDKTFGQAGNRRTFTVSFWIKTTTKETYNAIFDAGQDGSNSDDLYFHTGRLNFSGYYGSTQFALRTTAKFRDPSAWSHHVIAFDTTQGTASNRIKFFTNGVQETVFDDETYPSQNFQTSYMNTARLHNIGTLVNNDGFPLDGYLSEFVFIDGSALAPTDFGEFDEDSGIWKPIDVSGLTFGTNGFYLDFEDSAALGDDVSGNGNDFTVNNLTAIDQSTDTCTNNFATLNSLTKNNDTALSNGNLTATGTSSGINGTVGSGTIGIPSSGKWYYEIKVTNVVSSSYPRSGLISVDDTQFGRLLNADAGTPGYTTNSVGFFANGQKYYNNSASSFGSSLSNNDIVQWYVDMDNGAVYVGINDTVQNSGNPSSGASKTGAIWTFTAGTYTALMPATSDYNGSVQNFNFGSPPYTISSGNTDGNGYGNMEYAIPSGYYVLNTKNLAEFG